MCASRVSDSPPILHIFGSPPIFPVKFRRSDPIASGSFHAPIWNLSRK